MYEVYTGLLKMLDKFQQGDSSCSITYEVDADYNEVKEKYPLEQIAGEGTDEERSFRLLFWIAEHIKHKGDYDGHVQNTALALFEYAFDTENGINCAALSMALTECLLAVGIKARAVFIHPFSPYDCDNHVVCEAWSKERKKWMMLANVQGCQTGPAGSCVRYYFAPEGFDVKKHMLANIQYREELWGKQE